jgi:murein DD-endopeptidase MepM/ murein hydrolase activator NlpD
MSVLALVLMGVSGWAVIIFAALFSLIAAFAAGLLGHAFMNDGKTKAQIWGESDFLLPYDGDRYCVQGLRGWISHFGMQEFSYDWALPEGRPYMSAKEGHIIGFREDRHGTKACGKNPIANEIRVRHRDGSIARYLHGTRRGVSRVNPELRPVREQLPNNPVHVRAGQLLAETGNVGHSMFSHLHFTVLAPSGRATNPGDASDYLPVKFVGPSAGRHGGVCYSMRKYRSTSVNLGPVRVIAPAPGAPAPAVPASPWNDVRYGSESWDTAALGFSPPPAQTTPASPPPEIPPSQNLPDTFSPTPPRGVLV